MIVVIYIIFRNYFQHGYTPSLAYKQLLKDLRCECENEDNFVLKKADRSVCPRRGDFNNMYTDYCKTKYGGKNGDAMFENMVDRLKKYVDANTSAEMTYQIYNRDDDVPLIVVIVTPLMARVHSQVLFILLVALFIIVHRINLDCVQSILAEGMHRRGLSRPVTNTPRYHTYVKAHDSDTRMQ